MNTHEELVDKIISAEEKGGNLDSDLKDLIDDYLKETSGEGIADTPVRQNECCDHHCSRCHDDHEKCQCECDGGCEDCHCVDDCHDCSNHYNGSQVHSDEDNHDGPIDSLNITLINDATYSIDFKTLTAPDFISQQVYFNENILGIRSMLQNILILTGKEDHDKFVEHTIQQLDTFAKGMQITLNYDNLSDNLSRRDIAILMCHDTINIITQISNWVSLYTQIETLTSAMSNDLLENLVSDTDEEITNEEEINNADC